jgi:ribonuclease HII
MPDFKFEKRIWKRGFKSIGGVDEVGRGAFAGPIVTATVVFPANYEFKSNIKIDDSKKLTKLQREKANDWIKENCLAWGIGEASVATINKLGMTKATNIAFRRAIKNCSQKQQIDFLFIDAFFIPFVKGLRRKNQLAIVKGDATLRDLEEKISWL